MADGISMGARREVLAVVANRYRAAGRREKGRILDELTATTGWHRKHAVRALSQRVAAPAPSGSMNEAVASAVGDDDPLPRRRCGKYNGIRDGLVVLWEASDRVCGKRLVAMIPALLLALERHGRLRPTSEERGLLLSVSAATIDRVLVEVKIAAAGGRRRRVGFYSAIRREVPIRTFNDWGNPPPGFCEIDMVAHGGTSVAGSFIQTLTMVDIATGWTECLPLVARDELGERIGKRGIAAAAGTSPIDPLVFAQSLGTTATTREVRATHRRPKRKYKKRIRMPSKLDPHLATIESWLAAEPQLTALGIVRRLAEIDPATFGGKQHSIVQRLLRALRRNAAETVIAATATPPLPAVAMRPGPVDGTACDGQAAPPTGPPLEQASRRSGPHRSTHAPDPALPGNIPW